MSGASFSTDLHLSEEAYNQVQHHHAIWSRGSLALRHVIQSLHSARLHGNICFLELAEGGLSESRCSEAASHWKDADGERRDSTTVN